MKFHPWIKIVKSDGNIEANVEEDVQEETKIVVNDSEIVLGDGDEETHEQLTEDDMSEVEEMETVETSV